MTSQPLDLNYGRGTRHHGLVDRVYRERNRMTSLHRKPLSVDKHGCCLHIDSCPYGSVYLSPPPDTSWRRVNSDSALHQSTLTPAQQGPFNGGSQEIQPKRVLLLNVPDGFKQESEDGGQNWDCKKLSLSLKPAAHSTGGSLPDLTNLQFPPPLPTPLDSEDTGAGSYGSLHSLSTQQGNSTFPFLIRLLDNLFLIFVLGFSPGGSPQVRPGTTPLQTGLNWFSSIDNQSKPLYTGFLEQFNMFETPVSSDSLPYNQTSTLNYSQALMMGLSGPHLQDMQGLGFSNHGNIPNIILTVSGESPPGLNKDLGCLTTDLDLDSPFPLDDLRLDPLTLDGLHMLNDPDVILTDAATEDAFRMDRL
uniref:Uncharacterized protein n=1 Tax=Periophthalmus magnuspinnatus TaxID=409849 RepID=A0A3B4AWJ3_9GOBI